MRDMIVAAYAVLKESDTVSVLFRILLSVLCGGMIGSERGRAHQPAGMRTYMLVCLGAALVMITGEYMYDTFGAGDPSRMGAQVISGIGFLGAGSIMVSGKTRVRGLTTAAGLWTAASIGLAIGIGFYSAGAITTVTVYLILTIFKKMEYSMLPETVCYGLYIEVSEAGAVGCITSELKKRGIKILEVRGDCDEKKQKFFISIKNTSDIGRDSILKCLEEIHHVNYVKYVY